MSVQPEEGKAEKFGFIAALPASRLIAFALNDGGGRWRPYHLSPEKVSSIYHILTFSDSSQVSRGPNKESAPRATAYQAPKVKTRRSMKSPFSSCFKKFTSTSFMLKTYDFTSDSLTTECRKAPSVRLLRGGNAYQDSALPTPPTLHP